MKKLNILIADDEELLRDVLEMILESEFDCLSVKVANGNEAIAALKKNPEFDLIISDYNMPEANGGKIYHYNNENKAIPFFLFSGGDLTDYSEFAEFHKTGVNRFFNKPFNEKELLEAVRRVQQASDLKTEPYLASQYIKLSIHSYLLYARSSTEVFIKLSEEKFTKILNSNPENLPEDELLKHYQKKGIDFVYVERKHFTHVLQEIFHHIHQNVLDELKAETLYEIAGLHFLVSFEGLKDIGLTENQIEHVSKIIEDTVNQLMNDNKTKEQFSNLCSKENFVIGHSLLIVYIAGCICHTANLNFASTMKKLCMAAFYHDICLLDVEKQTSEMNLENLTELEVKFFMNHPALSADSVPDIGEVIKDTRKIILEHHELPDGLGYPKKLNAQQIAPLSALFILSQEIVFCMIRNNFSRERLTDFLTNKKTTFNQGNFAKFFKACETLFSLDT
jgi:response regulator RpfG family c-di-GMP phosphodiesterase